MQQDLWGDEVPQTTKKSRTRNETTTIIHTAQDCPIYGHDWQTIGMQGEKQCRACGITGYCPGCTRNPIPGALPFYCTAHTKIESTPVQE
jgi:hypothetical protein